MKSSASPLMEKERLDWVDAARGLAILGIFMVNVPAFNAPYFLYGGAEEYWTSTADLWVQGFVDIFFQASFYTLFSFLFGFGMMMMKERLEARSLSYKPIIAKRLMVLTGFGLIHAFLIWHGDILLTYGIFGFVMFLFFSVRRAALLLTALAMLTLLVGPITLALFNVREQLQGVINQAAINQALLSYSEGSLLEVWQQNWRDWFYANQPANLPFLFLSVVPLFLLGMYVYRKGWLHEPAKHGKAMWFAWFVTGTLFVTCKGLPYLYGNPEWFQLVQNNIGGSASALFYILSLTFIFQSSVGVKLLRPLVWVGRMSLTNYILQSVFCFLLFYSIGFGLYGQVSPFASLWIVIGFYSIQVLFSKYWLRRFRFGPLEWLWRTCTYGKKQPWKRKQPAVS